MPRKPTTQLPQTTDADAAAAAATPEGPPPAASPPPGAAAGEASCPGSRPATKDNARKAGRRRADAPPPREVPLVEVQSIERVPAMACPGCGRAVHPQIKRRYPDRVDCGCHFCGERWYYYPPRLEVLDPPPAAE